MRIVCGVILGLRFISRAITCAISNIIFDYIMDVWSKIMISLSQTSHQDWKVFFLNWWIMCQSFWHPWKLHPFEYHRSSLLYRHTIYQPVTFQCFRFAIIWREATDALALEVITEIREIHLIVKHIAPQPSHISFTRTSKIFLTHNFVQQRYSE